MFICDYVESFIDFLKNKNDDYGFLSDNFIALRDNDKNYIRTKEDTINHYLNYINNGLCDIERIKEDSHDLVFFMFDENKYILKIRLDENYKISSIVEEIYDENKNNIVLVIEYDGSSYYGMQKQPYIESPTIQGEIEKVLNKMFGKKVETIVASRTDRGVHAKGQVIQFECNMIDPEKIKYALNNMLPNDIRIKKAYKRSQLFNCRYDVVKKKYEYIIKTGEYSVFDSNYVCYIKNIDVDKINEELKSLIGTHDFYSFCKGENDNTLRTIYEASLNIVDDKIVLSFVGNGFLHNMIRLIVGSIFEYIDGKGKSIKEIIESKNKRLTNRLASASGLYLIEIDY